MSDTNQNKQLVTSYLAALNGRPKTPALVAQFVSDRSLAEHIKHVEASFPGYEIVAEQTVGEDDLVAVRGVFRGVHGGRFAGIEPTGRSVEAALFILYRIADGRISEHWMQFDSSGLMQQLKPVAAV